MSRSDFDVAVVGLGAMGSMSAWRMAARGAKVVGFDRFRPGHDRGSSHGDTRIFRTAYFESPDYVPLLQHAFELWRGLEAESGAELLTITGGLMIGPAGGELVSGVLLSARQNELPHRMLDARDMARLHPQHRLGPEDVAVFEARAGFLRPERSVAAAAARAEALGARIMPDTKVLSVKPTGAGVAIETSRGSFSAGHALVCAGAWTSKLLPTLAVSLEVERQVQAWLGVDEPAAFGPDRFPIFIREMAHARFRYGFPSTDGRRIKLAVHHEGTHADPDTIDREVSDTDLEPLREFALSCMHGVTNQVEGACVCMYTNAPDERFMAFSPSGMPGVTVLGACSGHGFKFASVMGELMADLLMEGKPPPAIIRSSAGA